MASSRINPEEIVKLRYQTARSGEERYWLGMEDSPVIWKNYLYIADNGGTLLCIDLNTMSVIWAQDVADDTNGSPVFSLEDGTPYLYTRDKPALDGQPPPQAGRCPHL